ncbi:MAG: hypothetical protein ACK551_06250 [Vampirovibrionales bacterium]
MTDLNTNTTSTTNQFKVFGKTVKVPYRVTLRDYTLANETRKSNYGKDKSGNDKYNENLYDLMGVVKDGKLVLSSRWQNNLGSFQLDDTQGIEAAISSWETTALANGYRKFLSGSSEIKGDLVDADSPTVKSPKEKASDDDTGNLFSRFGSTDFSSSLGGKAPKVATTFMGKTLISGQAKDVVEFKGNSAYNISVTYDSESGTYTVKAPIRGITENGKVFKNAKDAERAIAKYETAIKKDLEKTKKPEGSPNLFTKATNLPNSFNPNFKINGLKEYKLPDTKGVNVFDPNFKIEGFEKYKIPTTNTELLF